MKRQMRRVHPRVLEAQEMLNEEQIADLLKEATKRSIARELVKEIRIAYAGTDKEPVKKQAWKPSAASKAAHYRRRVARKLAARQQNAEAAE